LLGSEWRFALGSSGISLVSIAITQMDKLVVTRFFSLHEFGYYSVASSLAAATPILVSPIAQACYPRFCALHAGAGEGALRDFYRLASQWITVALAGPAATVVVLSSDVLLAWTGNRDVALHAAPVAVLLSLGFLFNGAMNAPYALYLAFGKTRLFLVANAVATVLLVPTMIVLVPRLGAAGAALGWLAYSAVSLAIVAPLAHSVTLPSETWRWPLRDVLLPVGAAFVSVLIVRVLSGWGLAHGRFPALGRVATGFAVATGAALLVAQEARASAGRMLAARLAASRPVRR
jgi:O-antigen/teichoic acid export membrane protein